MATTKKKPRTIKRRYGVVHGIAECHDCGKQFQCYKNAQALAAQHAKATGHKVSGEVEYAYEYDGGGE